MNKPNMFNKLLTSRKPILTIHFRGWGQQFNERMEQDSARLMPPYTMVRSAGLRAGVRGPGAEMRGPGAEMREPGAEMRGGWWRPTHPRSPLHPVPRVAFDGQGGVSGGGEAVEPLVLGQGDGAAAGGGARSGRAAGGSGHGGEVRAGGGPRGGVGDRGLYTQQAAQGHAGAAQVRLAVDAVLRVPGFEGGAQAAAATGPALQARGGGPAAWGDGAVARQAGGARVGGATEHRSVRAPGGRGVRQSRAP